MTNYNERFDEVLTTCDFEPDGFNSRICLWCGERKGAKIHTAKQALTSLTKELVAEAKPELKEVGKQMPGDMDSFLHNQEAIWSEQYINQFEQNILKALEEV